jgi:DtxR family Mn-dependent transcriptional regulator
MERDELLTLDEERRIHLTGKGQEIATDVMRKHRLAERHLLDQVGLPFELVHEEACRWEHVMSLEVETRIAAQVSPPYVDPYGNPIPGLKELGVEETGATAEGQENATWHVTLDRALSAEGVVDVHLQQIGEVAQTDVELLRDFAGHGVLPGAELRVRKSSAGYTLSAPGHDEVFIDAATAGQLVVSPSQAK